MISVLAISQGSTRSVLKINVLLRSVREQVCKGKQREEDQVFKSCLKTNKIKQGRGRGRKKNQRENGKDKDSMKPSFGTYNVSYVEGT